MKLRFLVALMFIGTVLAQDTPKPAGLNLKASEAVQLRILKAEHDNDQAILTKVNIEAAFHELQVKYRQAEDKEKLADKEVADAIDAAYKENGLSKDEYVFDPAIFRFSPKPKPAEKK